MINTFDPLSYSSPWVSGLLQKAREAMDLYQRGHMDNQALAFSLENIARSTSEYAGYEEQLEKQELVSYIQPIINQLKGA